ncbi:hypothetical protein [Blastococcus saxobsidens]|uniref:Uncharacterized protein n=1 Tax=Blastococcus saxobsidens TaxID=138336 RepID=A0A4Q7Y132_9ACTN|nr:hypothetical protein [Blastococcus saxobsidens]RZU30470.1 hypothetical protein BKA19_0086 [Blastococcus saxobsidens]
MPTVIERPHHAPVPSLVDGAVVRHLVEDGDQETMCGEPISGAREVRTSWSRTANRCPACEQAQVVS